ncbi:hypothetical protein ACH4D5_17990 [Streptomyces sp. NPDC018029]|uniref:hypothetical protein n=1 Tax=Streptomyces sp. NPDC018029 TaxID=3365032 RepID=UPI0037A8BB23
MRIRTAVAATALAAFAVLGGAGAAAANEDDGDYGIGNDHNLVTSVVENAETEFGDLVMD